MKTKFEEWEIRLNVAQAGHYIACEKYQKINNLLGIPLVILSSFVSAFLFFDQPSSHISLFLKIAGVVVVILASVQTFIRPSEKSEMHRVKATKYGSLKRKIELINSQPSLPGESPFIAKELITEWNSIAEDSPVTPRRIRKQIQKLIDDDLHKKITSISGMDDEQ